MDTEWISVKEALPTFDEEVLLWTRLDYEIGFLHDGNGKEGHTEWIGHGGTVSRSPNKKYPNNLEWNIGGHWLDFKETTHWAKLLPKPTI